MPMWKSVVCGMKYNQGYVYVVQSKSRVSGGKVKVDHDAQTEYEPLPISFVPEANKTSWSPNGMKNTATAKAAVPGRFFTHWGFLPSRDDLIIRGTVRYRITSIEDYTDKPHIGLYYFYLKRDEHAKVRM